ncbi:hypothetical protein KIL84_000525 [Mauremys mutica]|uniref:Uncharacterized protein n=1 Tax=Mauremys mutica TaxID=74926 RepID=A0A9D3WYX7_9SAUR|nr:hypothetical protein KIL84_000525 [Mauremys mutica]
MGKNPDQKEISPVSQDVFSMPSPKAQTQALEFPSETEVESHSETAAEEALLLPASPPGLALITGPGQVQ